MDSFKEKLILITGATSGIGKEISLALSAYQTNLMILGRNERVLKQLKDETKKTAKIDYLKIDFSNDEELDLMLNNMNERNIEPDILIHCAGTFQYGSISDTSDKVIDQSYKINLRAPFILTKSLLEGIKQKKGQILFVNSTASVSPKSNVAVYASFKSALKTFAEVLHHEVYPFGVRVSTIYCGRVATPMQEMVCKLEGREYSPENYISAHTIAETVINLLKLPSNVEISELTIRPTNFIKL